MIRTFVLHREVDASGVSGTGTVLEGCVFSDGTTIVRWTAALRSTAIYASYADFEAIHIEPHPENRSRVEWGPLELPTISQ